MIIKGGSRTNRRFFARHLMNVKDNERAGVVEFRGFAHENVDDAFRDMEAVATDTNCKNFFYHAALNPREGERLTEAQWTGAVDTLERHLGLEGQARIVFEHEKEGRVHRHVVWSRIDLDTMTARTDSLTYKKHEAAAREIEQDCGLDPVASVLVKDREGPRPVRRAKDFEGFRGVRSGLDPEDVKSTVTALWHESDNGASFRAALEENGYVLCRGDRRDFCIIDPAGDDHSLARRIEGVKAAEIRDRLKDIDRDALPSVAEGRMRASAWEESGDNDAARAVRWHEMETRMKALRPAIENGLAHQPSSLDAAANEYALAVKGMARAGQDAYWQAFVGGKLKTEADKLHALMWGREEKEKEPEWER